jgi:hypothetical protein
VVGRNILEGVVMEDIHHSAAVVFEDIEAVDFLKKTAENSLDIDIQEEEVAGNLNSVGILVACKALQLLEVCTSPLALDENMLGLGSHGCKSALELAGRKFALEMDKNMVGLGWERSTLAPELDENMLGFVPEGCKLPLEL